MLLCVQLATVLRPTPASAILPASLPVPSSQQALKWNIIDMKYLVVFQFIVPVVDILLKKICFHGGISLKYIWSWLLYTATYHQSITKLNYIVPVSFTSLSS